MTRKIARRMSEIRIKSSGRKMIPRIHKSTLPLSSSVKRDEADEILAICSWSEFKKWRTMAICCFLTLGVTFASSAPSSTAQFISAEFGVGSVVANFSTSFFL